MQNQFQPTRRNFIVGWMAAILGVFGLAIAAPLAVYVFPAPKKGEKNEDLLVTLPQTIESLSNNNAIKFEAPQGAAFVMATGGGDNSPGDPTFGGYVVKDAGKLHVFAVTCPHLGCSINIVPSAKMFKCPCHGSEFFLNGDVKHGPAVAPLARLNWKRGSKPNEIKVYGMLLGQGGS